MAEEEETKLKPRPGTPRPQSTYLAGMTGEKVLARMIDGRPLNAILEGYNAYEIQFNLGNGKKLMVFKHAISSIEYVQKGGA